MNIEHLLKFYNPKTDELPFACNTIKDVPEDLRDYEGYLPVELRINKNALVLMHDLLVSYDPEPWECSLVNSLIRCIEKAINES